MVVLQADFTQKIPNIERVLLSFGIERIVKGLSASQLALFDGFLLIRIEPKGDKENNEKIFTALGKIMDVLDTCYMVTEKSLFVVCAYKKTITRRAMEDCMREIEGVVPGTILEVTSCLRGSRAISIWKVGALAE